MRTGVIASAPPQRWCPVVRTALVEADGRTRRATEKRRRRRADILTTALRLFGDKGYHRTSISDIIGGAGVARGTFYLYFESKEAIFLELLDELFNHLKNNVVGVDTGAGKPPIVEQLRDTVSRIVATLDANRELTAVILRAAASSDAEVRAALARFEDDIESYIAKALDAGVRVGLVRQNLEPRMAASGILGAFKQMAGRHILDPTAAVDAATLTHQILVFTARGVVADSLISAFS